MCLRRRPLAYRRPVRSPHYLHKQENEETKRMLFLRFLVDRRLAEGFEQLVVSATGQRISARHKFTIGPSRIV